VRALETAADRQGHVHPADGWTDEVITPGRGVRAVDGLITGWHEPQASHLELLRAVAGDDLLDAGLVTEHRWLANQLGDRGDQFNGARVDGGEESGARGIDRRRQ